MKLKDTYSLEKSYDQPRQHIKKQRHYFVNKGLCSQDYDFSSSHVWIWRLDYKESWVLKHRCFWTVVLEKTLGRLLDCKEIQPVHPKGNQSWVFIGRTDAETPNTFGTWCEELTHLKRLGRWERLNAGGERDDRGWDGWMASLTQWTWVWVNSGSGGWTRKPGVLWSMGSQRVRHDWATELNWKVVRNYHVSLSRREAERKLGKFIVSNICIMSSSINHYILCPEMGQKLENSHSFFATSSHEIWLYAYPQNTRLPL